MKFGIMDHVDDSGLAQADQFAQRLRLVEAMDRLGFYSYHVAEHHGTPLGLSPSPSVYLSAVAQRTTRLKFGPMVYVAGLYHPMRLAEEICMLDQMSGGRLQVGLGRGAVWPEHEVYGFERDAMADRYAEARDILLQALASPRVNFRGRYFQVPDFRMVLRPLQQPHPPLWYGLGNPESAAWAAANAANVVSLQPAAVARRTLDRFCEEWNKLGRPAREMPMRGLARFVVVAPTDEAAQRIAGVGYDRWRSSFSAIWEDRAVPLPYPRPEAWPGIEAEGLGIAGTPKRVVAYLTEQAELTGCTLFLCQMVFGAIAYEDALASLTLFAREVAPALAER